MIPFFGVKRQYANLKEELLNATDAVYSSGQVLDGPYTKKFEQAIAHRCNRTFAVTVNSCTQGLVFAQQALFSENVKILIPGVSFVATLNSVLLNGNTPVFCDVDNNALIDLNTLNNNLEQMGIGGIMYPNLFGHIVDYDKFKLTTEFFNNVPVIEDAAQSFGASYKGQPSGSLGNISCLSFDPTKNLNNYGSGGMVLTDDPDVYNDLLDLRDNGKHGHFTTPGTNSKMSEADCAQMLVKLKYFDDWQKRRTAIAEYYTNQMSNYLDVVSPGEDVTSAWSKFVVRLTERHALKYHLGANFIETKVNYDVPLFEHSSGINYVDWTKDVFMESASYTRECLSLPIYPELTDEEVERVADAVQKFFV